MTTFKATPNWVENLTDVVRGTRTSLALTQAMTPRQLASARRTGMIVVAMFVMGLLDLMFTVTYIRSIGMYEANPIARHIVQNGSVGQLVIFKLFTMGISCGAIYYARRLWKAEVAAWFCALLLCSLMVHWVNYAHRVESLGYEFVLLMQNEELAGPGWVRLD
jgi:hypothetical protein